MATPNPPGKRYLAHALLRFIGKSGANCTLRTHPQFAATEWELCILQDIEREEYMLKQGSDAC